MAESASPKDLQVLIGYTFKDETLLEDALTRRSSLNEHPTGRQECMDPLATVGDAILNAVVSCKLYEDDRIRDKGMLTIKKSDKVRREKTRAFGEKHLLRKYVRWGTGETRIEAWKTGDKSYDMVTEALIGAVYLDAQRNGKNGMKIVDEMLTRLDYFE